MLSEAFLESFATKLESQNSFWILVSMGFLGGLMSSLLPCVLSLLPINLAYIGTLNIQNRKEAFIKASQFVLGVALVMSVLGVSISLSFAVFSAYKPIINIIVGSIVFIMAVALLDIIKLPLPKFITKIPDSNPFLIGMAFALVSSPCSSPVLVSVITIASSLNSILSSLFLMFSYSIGYTAIIFTASLSTGLIKQLDWFKKNSQTMMRISAAMLMCIGAYYIYTGISSL
ncbi:MAG: cytochrome c biogenesis protein CcdA [Candidatus Caenarcaniphilales bacterium]|jgi:cytochrome c-type biogenesis protein|nr:cytochrome c biogenesis protein CcdA [Candidatus Caenarcaniphilales bacterium]